ncbi:MAG: DUF4394 domain-containing protein [Betaproteobacteria bacterium]|nr:MAG: DUF4394 domain-containing protein [Betaproteobacteria bacterium]
MCLACLKIPGRFVLLFVTLFFAASSGQAQGVVLFGYLPFENRLISFNAAAPGTLLSNVALTGLAGGERLTSMEFRPKTGELYAIAKPGLNSIRLVKINPITGAVSDVGPATTLLSASYFGLAFDPVADIIRLVSNVGSNLRINPDTGAIITPDNALFYASGDPNFGVTPSIVHAAHSNAYQGAGTTTLYGIDTSAAALVRIGGVGGSPSPGTGSMTTIGLLGFTVSDFGGLSIAPKGNVAYALMRTGLVPMLYVVDLNTGSAQTIGAVGINDIVEGLAASPVSECLDLDGNGIVTPMTDGLMLLRALLGMTHSAVTEAALPPQTPPRSTWNLIRAHMNANCGMSFAN